MDDNRGIGFLMAFAFVVFAACLALVADSEQWQKNASSACSKAGGHWTVAIDDRGSDTRVCTRDGVVLLTQRGFK